MRGNLKNGARERERRRPSVLPWAITPTILFVGGEIQRGRDPSKVPQNGGIGEIGLM